MKVSRPPAVTDCGSKLRMMLLSPLLSPLFPLFPLDCGFYFCPLKARSVERLVIIILVSFRSFSLSDPFRFFIVLLYHWKGRKKGNFLLIVVGSFLYQMPSEEDNGWWNIINSKDSWLYVIIPATTLRFLNASKKLNSRLLMKNQHGW